MTETQVTLAGERPSVFVWKKRPLLVEWVTDHWMELGRWWNGESAQEFFLILSEGRLFLLTHLQNGGTWHVKPVH